MLTYGPHEAECDTVVAGKRRVEWKTALKLDIRRRSAVDPLVTEEYEDLRTCVLPKRSISGPIA
jgi:hypothetical protein